MTKRLSIGRSQRLDNPPADRIRGGQTGCQGLRPSHNSALSLAASSPGPVKRSTIPRLPVPVDRDADERVLQQVVTYYHETLTQSPEALAYLESRGLRSPEMITHFQLGFANRTLGYRLPATNRAAGAALRGVSVQPIPCSAAARGRGTMQPPEVSDGEQGIDEDGAGAADASGAGAVGAQWVDAA